MDEKDPLTEKVIGAAIEVHRILGPGLLESVYQKCLCYELGQRRIVYEAMVELPVIYKGTKLDCHFVMDLVLPGLLVVELKAVDELHPVHSCAVAHLFEVEWYSSWLAHQFPCSSSERRHQTPDTLISFSLFFFSVFFTLCSLCLCGPFFGAFMNLARGYRFAGVPCGLRPAEPDRLDLASVVSDLPAAAAGVFTQNRVVAAPVQIDRGRVPTGARGLVICSGNANACTGQRGLDDARRMTALAAAGIGCRPEQILVCSTGVIGRPLPMPRIEDGIGRAIQALDASSAAFERAACAILTTDTRPKVSSQVVSIDDQEFSVDGLRQGRRHDRSEYGDTVGLCADRCRRGSADLARLADQAVEPSFNSISVEGHTSTNDTLLLFANGAGRPLQGDNLALLRRRRDVRLHRPGPGHHRRCRRRHAFDPY